MRVERKHLERENCNLEEALAKVNAIEPLRAQKKK
jgi:hypothetical protein